MDIKILVADDEPTIVELIKRYLEQEGYTVYIANDGDQALAIEKHHRPDLLILNVMLPKLSGWDVCQSLTRPVFIIFLSTNTREDNLLTAFSLGADDYMTKPFSPLELVARVKALLRRKNLAPVEFSCGLHHSE